MAKKYRREHRRRIGQAVSRSAAEFPRALPEKKRCSSCRKWQPSSAFVIRKRKLKSGATSVSLNAWCRKCTSAGTKRWRKEKKARGEMAQLQSQYYEKWYAGLSPKRREAKNRYQREWMATRRREEGRSVTGSRTVKQELQSGDRLDPLPLIEMLERELPRLAKDRNEANAQQGMGDFLSNGTGILAEISGVSPRRLYALLHGEQELVALSTVDKILSGLGLPHMLPILYPED
jgi:hypothetical protein